MRQSVTLDPNDAEVHFFLGSILADKKQEDAAIAEYWEALRLDPQHARAYASIGILLSRQGHYDASLEKYRQAFALDPSIPGLRRSIALKYFLKGQVRLALRTWLGWN